MTGPRRSSLIALVQAAFLKPGFGSGYLQHSMQMPDLVAEDDLGNMCTTATQERRIYCVVASLDSVPVHIGTNFCVIRQAGVHPAVIRIQQQHPSFLPPFHVHACASTMFAIERTCSVDAIRTGELSLRLSMYVLLEP